MTRQYKADILYVDGGIIDMNPEQATFMLKIWIPMLQKEHDTTKSVIQAVPLDKGDYRPDAVSKTALELAWHIAASEQRFFHAVSSGAFDFTPIPCPDSVKNSADIVKWFDASFAESMAQVEKLSGDQLAKMLDFRGMFQWPAVAFLQLATNHTIHHRGQLSVYLRPMGAKVPSIYGESYDAAQERLAKQQAQG